MCEPVPTFNKTFPLVTIAIPTYNRADRYLRLALESAQRQTYPNLEIIVSDNCSVDDTEKLITEITDSRIRYFRHKINIGPNNNLNFCLQQARGVFFLLLCDDDLLDDDFIETCMNAIHCDADVGIITTGVRIINSNGELIRQRANMGGGSTASDFFIGWLTGKAPLYLCNTLLHTERLKNIGGFQSKYNLYDDTMAIFHLATKFGRVHIRDIKASQRLHESKLSFLSRISEWCEESLALLDLMCDLVSEKSVQIRQQGMRVLSRRNYFRARAVRSPLKRSIAYMIVFKKFHYRYPPPIFRRRLHPRRLRGIKLRMK
jgi:glycosyltransferase involved in cell wall biosynthesis